MKITATYRAEDEAYTIEADEQRIVIPGQFMKRFISCAETALYRQRLAINQECAERMRKAKALVEAANHPAILPFAAEKPPEPPPEPKRPGRPKGSRSPKKRLKTAMPQPKKEKEPEPPPFHHTPFR